MTDTPLLLGVDLGTTSVKAVVFTHAGRAAAVGRHATPWTVTADGAETSAEGLRDATFAAIRSALDHAPAGRIAGIGIASFAEAGVLLDAAGESLAPVIAWYDRRDTRELAELSDRFGGEFSTMTGLPLAQQWSLTKSRWLGRHHPEAVARARLRLNMGDWIAHALGGRAASEPSLASRTGWLALAERAPWPAALEYAGVAAEWVPELADAGTDLGAVQAGIHPRLTGARIAVAGHDHQAAAVGAGAWHSGDTLDSCGTAEALVRTADPGLSSETVARLTAGGVTVGWHALPGQWCLLGASEGGRALGTLLAALEVQDLTAGIDARARALHASPRATTLPSVGSDTSAADIRARAAAARDTADDGAAAAALWRGSVERVTGEARELADLMATAAGPSKRMLAVGGWTASAALVDAKRRQLGRVELPEIEEAGARGAALFAGVAAGMWDRVANSEF
ncbi:FGGY-family carbohydrate kinase [Leucobacter luti]|uniref:Sugar (Pentulose or hexulose) kinase n=1 Tax=Leucobacter luti TaxID=340320 RepID=A0A4Q7U0R9_9MICO|nr:FGGY family carbohydrate kinase [Leucobacter luti]RZT66833.1 sugar (pentulose or hexulose) kinase [Leucobacter luti]